MEITGAFEHKASGVCHLHTEDLNQNEFKSQQQRLRDRWGKNGIFQSSKCGDVFKNNGKVREI